MPQKKKLQIFVSSTYEDLRAERQAAVEAILMAGHIPAGMELFAAGDESQMNVIKRWIDESDIFMLILGGRYGSIESVTKKSYVHLEYEYAVEKRKPLFAIVIEDNTLIEKVKESNKLDVIEQHHPDKLREFRELVCSKLVRFWRDPRDIKLAIMETVMQFSDRGDMIGWIPADESINAGAIAEELARLTKENTQLKEQIEKISRENIYLKDQLERASETKYSGLTFIEMTEQLRKTKLNSDEVVFFDKSDASKVVDVFGDQDFSTLHAFWMLSGFFQAAEGLVEKNKLLRVLSKLIELGLIQKRIINHTSYYFISQTGREYFLRLKTNLKLEEAENYRSK